MKNYIFGNYICELREKNGLSQSQLGQKLGVTNKAVSRWENGSAYPSAELMLPLAKELGVSIEALYKVISVDKSPKTKLRVMLDFFAAHSKIITVICIALALVPYILFICFSTIPQKITLALATPFVLGMVYIAFYFLFFFFRKNPFMSSKVIDIFAVVPLVFMTVIYIIMLSDFIAFFPNGFNDSLCIPAIAFMSITHNLKKRYK